MKNPIHSTPPERAEALRTLLAHHHAGERHAPDGDGHYWITYLVGRGRELDQSAAGQASCFGYLCVRADGALAAEEQAARLLSARAQSLGPRVSYTVCAVHSAAQLLHGLFAIEALRAGVIPASPSDGDLEPWEENLSAQLERFASGS